ncbi:MAG: 5'/3'-nucleotidase SurE [Proteobacteria bacterium]|nr:5'/3'-nucleotidase SurE [Pseudomonadota bacterium]MBU1687844.1 5'/3'-nucleotidase SurE [Pseudomonadota bacterium]
MILVTNDDGIHAPGLAALANALQQITRTVIIAPEQDSSAASYSLTMRRPLRVRELSSDRYAIDGTPTDCVTIGVAKILHRRPDLVVSGINPGANLGDDISYSGTVSAAVEATMLGIPSFAVSLAAIESEEYQTAAAFAGKLARMILAQGLPDDTLLNVNVPGGAARLIKGIRLTRQARRSYEDSIMETTDPWGRRHYWIGGGTVSWDSGESSDSQAVAAGHISITPLHLDRTNYGALQTLSTTWLRQLNESA